MRFHGLRWTYEIENSVVAVDNAIGEGFWSQERLVVNLEPLYQGGGHLRFYQSFTEEWLTRDGEVPLKVSLSPGIGAVRCRVMLGKTRLESINIARAAWYGDRWAWPADDEWG